MAEHKTPKARSLPEYVAVGTVLGAAGTAGAVRVRPLTDFPERLLDLTSVRLERSGLPGGQSGWVRVRAARQTDAGYVMEFEGIATRSEAAALRGAFVQIPVAETRPLPPGRFYRFSVIGLLVRDENGRELGHVREILETGANDVYVVMPEGKTDRRDEILVPALKEIVRKLDLEEGVVVVRLPRVWDGPP